MGGGVKRNLRGRGMPLSLSLPCCKEMDKKEKEKELEGGGITKSRSEFEERGINLQAKKESCFKRERESLLS